MILEKDRNFALLTHLSGFGSYIFPFGSVLIPFVIRETKKEESEFINNLTKEVINFNLSYLLYTFALKLFIVPVFIGSFFENIFNNHYYYINNDFESNYFFGITSYGSILFILMMIKFILIIKASIDTNEGKDFKYPYTIQFIK